MLFINFFVDKTVGSVLAAHNMNEVWVKNWILSFRRFCVKKRKVYHMNLTINSFKKNK